MLRTVLRPKWLIALVLALVVAAGFALLGRWQLEQAVLSAGPEPDATVSGAPVSIAEVATPQVGLLDASIGRQVVFGGVFDPRDFEIVAERLQGDAVGFWVVGHVYVTDDGVAPAAPNGITDAPGIAVALGWAPDRATAEAARTALAASTPQAAGAATTAFAGRLEYAQSPSLPTSGHDGHELAEMAPAHLVNRWAEAGPSNYGSYVILDLDESQRAGLAAIETREVVTERGLNWLNVFYAIEWVIFAGFALFVWWRLARDEYERDRRVAAAGRADGELERSIRLDALRRLRDERGPADS